MSCASCRLNFMEGAEVGQSQMRIESLVELVAAQLPGLPATVRKPSPGPDV
ncbi:hypothetical protein LP415_06500 [Polaromonas sp. P1(28)-8]|nr:hypothetical protein LP415_06500 [Polaromonas sp. P1(28)-8]